MGRSTLARDYDIGRQLADHERRISALERQMLGLAYLTPEFVAVQACRVTRNATQSITNNTVTTVNFNAEVFDPTGMHDNAVNNSRITIAVDGYYVVGFNAEFASAADYNRTLVSVTLNGGNRIAHQQVPGTAVAAPPRHAVGTMIQLVAGDYIEAEVFQSNTAPAARNLSLVGDYSPVMFAARIGS
jgi:hypothetical protein